MSDRPAETSHVPRTLWLGVIVWSDDPEVEPTVIADRSPVALARTMAVTIHEMLENSDAYAGATEFLQSNPPPQDWVEPRDVDNWLEALREATPHPSFSFHRVSTAGGADGTNYSFVNRYLEQALREREQALAEEPSSRTYEGPSARTFLER